MSDGPRKCVILVADDLPAGAAANTAAVLAFTLGARLGSSLGPDVPDAAGRFHAGITTIPFPILTAPTATMADVRLAATGHDDLFVVGFTDVAQEARTYAGYAARLATTAPDDLTYLGLALFGPRPAINRLTGRFVLLP